MVVLPLFRQDDLGLFYNGGLDAATGLGKQKYYEPYLGSQAFVNLQINLIMIRGIITYMIWKGLFEQILKLKMSKVDIEIKQSGL